jgi:hypothetical protein
MGESAAHHREKKLRKSARPLLRAANQILLQGGILDSKLATKVSAAAAALSPHHGSTVPPAVRSWLQGGEVVPVIEMTWQKQTKRQMNQYHNAIPKEHKYVFCGKFSGQHKCKHAQYFSEFSSTQCEGCRKLWSDSVLLRALQAGSKIPGLSKAELADKVASREDKQKQKEKEKSDSNDSPGGSRTGRQIDKDPPWRKPSRNSSPDKPRGGGFPSLEEVQKYIEHYKSDGSLQIQGNIRFDKKPQDIQSKPEIPPAEKSERSSWLAKKEADIDYNRARGSWQEAQSAVEVAASKVDTAKKELDLYKTKLTEKHTRLREKLDAMQEAKNAQRKADEAHQLAVTTASAKVAKKKPEVKVDSRVDELSKALQQDVIATVKASQEPMSEKSVNAINALIAGTLGTLRAEIAKLRKPELDPLDTDSDPEGGQLTPKGEQIPLPEELAAAEAAAQSTSELESSEIAEAEAASEREAHSRREEEVEHGAIASSEVSAALASTVKEDDMTGLSPTSEAARRLRKSKADEAAHYIGKVDDKDSPKKTRLEEPAAEPAAGESASSQSGG